MNELFGAQLPVSPFPTESLFRLMCRDKDNALIGVAPASKTDEQCVENWAAVNSCMG